MEKLVRDGIPQVMRDAGAVPTFRIANPHERIPLLFAKLREELDELEAGPSLDELVDVVEALRALQSELGIGDEALEAVRSRKHDARGGFCAGIVLEV